MRLSLVVLILVTLTITLVRSEHSQNNSSTKEKLKNSNNTTSLADIFNYNDNNEELFEDSARLLNIKKLSHNLKRSFKKIFHVWAFYSPEFGLCKCVLKTLWLTQPIVSEVTYKMLGRSKGVLNMFYNEFSKGFKSSQHSDYHPQPPSHHEQYGYPYSRVDLQAQDGTNDIVDNTHLFKLQVQSLTEKPPKLNIDQSKIQVALNTLNLIKPKQQSSVNSTARSSSSGRALSGVTNFVSKKLNLPPPDHTYFKNGNYYHIHDLRHEKGIYGGPSILSNNNNDFENAILSLLGLGPPGRVIKPTFSVCSKQYLISAFVRFVYKYFF